MRKVEDSDFATAIRERAVHHPVRHFIFMTLVFFGGISFADELGRISGIVHGSLLVSFLCRLGGALICGVFMTCSARRSQPAGCEQEI